MPPMALICHFQTSSKLNHKPETNLRPFNCSRPGKQNQHSKTETIRQKKGSERPPASHHSRERRSIKGPDFPSGMSSVLCSGLHRGDDPWTTGSSACVGALLRVEVVVKLRCCSIGRYRPPRVRAGPSGGQAGGRSAGADLAGGAQVAVFCHHCGAAVGGEVGTGFVCHRVELRGTETG